MPAEKYVIESSGLAPLDHQDFQDHRRESFMHLVAREGRVVLHVIIVLSLIAVLVTMWTPFLFLQVIPLTILLAAYVTLVIANEVEHRSAKATGIAAESTAVPPEQADIEEDESELPAQVEHRQRVTNRLIMRESVLGAVILAGLIVAALVLARFVIPAQVFWIGVFFVFTYMLLLGAPLWLAWIQDDIDIEAHRMAREGAADPEDVPTPEPRAVTDYSASARPA